jgi:hypothetical protein
MNAKILVAEVMVMSAMAAAPALASDEALLHPSPYSFGGAGEYEVKTPSGSLLDGYAPETIVNDGFDTFCVEAGISSQDDVWYWYTLSDTDSLGRPLTEGAAYLYSEFAQGELQGYNYTDPTERCIDAGELQSALWALQGNQFGTPVFPTGHSGNPFFDLAVATLGSENITAPNDGRFDVEVLQLWGPGHTMIQNQLVLESTGVPEPSSASLALLALGCAAAFLKKPRV